MDSLPINNKELTVQARLPSEQGHIGLEKADQSSFIRRAHSFLRDSSIALEKSRETLREFYSQERRIYKIRPAITMIVFFMLFLMAALCSKHNHKLK